MFFLYYSQGLYLSNSRDSPRSGSSWLFFIKNIGAAKCPDYRDWRFSRVVTSRLFWRESGAEFFGQTSSGWRVLLPTFISALILVLAHVFEKS